MKTQTQRAKADWSEAVIAREHLGLPETEQGKEISHSRVFRRHLPLPTL